MMLVAIPVWTTMSGVCHCVKRHVAIDPFLDFRRVTSLGVGSCAGVSPSVVPANRMIFLNVGSSFFQALISVSSFPFSSSAVANLSFCWSSIVFARRLIPSASWEGVVWVMSGVVGWMCVSCVLFHHVVLSLSVAIVLEVCVIAMVSGVFRVKDHRVRRRGKNG